MSAEAEPYSMPAARLPVCTSLQPVCKFYKHSGTCRYKHQKCEHLHVRQALPEGSQSLPSYSERSWTLSSTEEEEPHNDRSWRFSVASYNILADKYAKHYRSYLYHEVPSSYLDWHHRRSAIVAELAHLQPDIICLQEVDRYEDLEFDLQQLGYSGIYLQRDGGRRDGCATFWRTSLLKPALVRQLRYSQYDLKDNVALLVLFEPHSAADAAATSAAGQASAALQQEQVLPQMESLQLHEQEQQEQQEQQRHRQDLLSQWLPRSWLSSSSHHPKPLPKPTHPGLHHWSSSSSMYQLPAEQQGHRSSSWAGNSSSSFNNSSLSNGDAAVAAPAAVAVAGSSHSSVSERRSSSKHSRKGSRRGSRGGNSAADDCAAAADGADIQQQAAAAAAAEEVQLAPDWHHCGLLVANTHIIFTPEKGEVKLGQARMLLEEVSQMAEWYLNQQQHQQQQQQEVVANGSSAAAQPAENSSSSSSRRSSKQGSSSKQAAAAAAAPQPPRGVATIIAGDFNATPHSPMYSFLARGHVDLHRVNRRNVSHMSSGGSPFAKGYRGFRRLQKRRSIDEQRQSVEERRMSFEQQQQQQQQYGAGSQQQQGLAASPANQQAWVAAAAVGGSSSTNGVLSLAAAADSSSQGLAATAARAAAASPAAPGCSGVGLCPNSSSAAAASPGTPAAASSSMGYTYSASPSSSRLLGSSSYLGGTGGTGSTGGTGGSSQEGKQHRWSDKEVRRAAGMSYDELLGASAAASTSAAATANGAAAAAAPRPHSPNTKIARAAAAFGAQVAAGAGAAAASVAAAAAAESHDPPHSFGAAAAGFAAGLFNAGGSEQPAPLLLQHGLQLRSCYESVLGREPEYTSSHSLFMDTCDYIWYTEVPVTQQQQQHQTVEQQQQQQRTQGDDCSSSGNSSDGSSGCSSSSSITGDGPSVSQELPTVAAAALAGASAGAAAAAAAAAAGCSEAAVDGTADRGAESGSGGWSGYELKPVAVLVPPDGMRLPKGLPSRWLGSDHVCLVADFELSLRD